MGVSLSKFNNRLSFDFVTYLQDRDELVEDLRDLTVDAAWHRRVRGSWQMVQGASGVASGIAGSVALAPIIGLGMVPAIAATTAFMVGNSIAAASLASSAASYGYEHVVDKDMAKRWRNLRHLVQSIAIKDQELSQHIVVKTIRALNDEKPSNNCKKNKENDSVTATTQSTGGSTDLMEDTVDSFCVKSIYGCVPIASTNHPPAIAACQKLCSAWDKMDLATKEDKAIGLDLAVALARSSGVILGTKSIIEGSKSVQQEHDLEATLRRTIEAIEKETSAIRRLDFRYLSCVPTEPKLPRGRLQHIDNGGGQVDMVVSFDPGCGSRRETLQSDSTQRIRLPEHATNVEVRFKDRAGKMVRKVNRASPHQEWVYDEQGKSQLMEICHFDSADGVDAVFLVRGSLTHAYIHKAWDFGRPVLESPRNWEWWDNVAEEAKLLVPDVERRIASRLQMPSSVSVVCCQCFFPDSLKFGVFSTGTTL